MAGAVDGPRVPSVRDRSGLVAEPAHATAGTPGSVTTAVSPEVAAACPSRFDAVTTTWIRRPASDAVTT